MTIERKSISFEVKARASDTADDPAGSFEGIGACFNNIDSANDIIPPGAFSEYLPKFLADGFVGGLNHDWDQPIGHPVEATEQPPIGLRFKAVFDDTPDAQAVRVKMMPHPVSGRATIRKLSIGYKVLDAEKLADPDAVHAYWAGQKYAPSPDDLARLKSAYAPRKDPVTNKPVIPGVRLLKKLALYEISPVAVPANDRAAILATKGTGTHMATGLGMNSESKATGDGPLGDTGRAIAWSVVSRLHDLLCWALYGILDNELLPLAQRLQVMSAAIDQFRDDLMRFLPVLLSGDVAAGEAGATGQPSEYASDSADSAETMSAEFEAMNKRFREMFNLPEDDSIVSFSAKLWAVSAHGFADQARAVVSAVDGFVSRADERADARSKSNRKLSQANVDALTSVADAMGKGADRLRVILGAGIGNAEGVAKEADQKTEDAGTDGTSQGRESMESTATKGVDPSEVEHLFLMNEARRWGLESLTPA
jgi:HK97 family phage prohead protease